MVDLAFLLLTFFILTSTFNNQHVIDLPMPDRDGPQSPVSHKNVMNLALTENNKLYWWEGLEGKVQATNYSSKGLRKLLIERTRNNSKLIVLIKPSDKSKYENLVDVLDEIRITGAERYAIVDFTEEDRNKISREISSN